jgi:hypothetical protein
MPEKNAAPRQRVKRDARGRVVSRVDFDAEGRIVLIDGIGAEARYSYTDGDVPIAVTYFDARGKVIPVEVEVDEIVPDSTAARIGMQPGDRLLAYAGQKLRSLQQLIYLVGKPGEGGRKLTFRRAGNITTIEVPPGRLGVVISNVRALPPPDATSR